MAAHTRPTVTQAKDALRNLKNARRDLAAFLDPDNPDCGVPAQVRRDANRHNYLSSWVLGPIDLAIEKLETGLGIPLSGD